MSDIKPWKHLVLTYLEQCRAATAQLPPTPSPRSPGRAQPGSSSSMVDSKTSKGSLGAGAQALAARPNGAAPKPQRPCVLPVAAARAAHSPAGQSSISHVFWRAEILGEHLWALDPQQAWEPGGECSGSCLLSLLLHARTPGLACAHSVYTQHEHKEAGLACAHSVTIQKRTPCSSIYASPSPAGVRALQE